MHRPALLRLTARFLRRLTARLRTPAPDYDIADWGFDEPRTRD